MVKKAPIEKIWVDGTFIDAKNATESILAHGLHYGVGVFEGVRYYDTKQGQALFHWDKHLDRLYQSAKPFGLNIEYDRETLTEATLELVQHHEFDDGYVRPITYFGPNQDGIKLFGTDECPKRVAVMVWPRDSRVNEEGISATVSSWKRMNSAQVPTTMKATGPYASNLLAGIEARRNGYDNAIMLNDRGQVAEGATANLFLVRDSILYTPGPAADVLNGITKKAVVALARDLGYEVDNRASIARGELYTADELFLTGTAAEMTPILSVDDINVGDGRVGTCTEHIKNRFYEIVRQEIEEYKDWFTYV